MLESKKYDLIEWIISIADEKIIDAIQSVKDKADFSISKGENGFSYSTSSYQEIQARKVDLEKLKKEQNYQPTPTDELSTIAREANIEQTIDFLLDDLKAMG